MVDGELPPGLTITPEGWLRTDPAMLPEAGGLDGFFIARWQATDINRRMDPDGQPTS